MKFLTFFLIFTLFSVSAFASNLHLIQEDVQSGFAIYRTSKPKKIKSMKKLCDLGIEEIAVLSGNAEEYEEANREGCPNLKIVYNEKQSARVPMTKSFIDWFDGWVAEAKRTGKKIAFRCNCGCHRTGRLAGYYQMKHQSLTAKDAKAIMKKHGKYMFLFKTLNHQLVALKDYIDGKACSTKAKYCVREDL